MRGLTPVRVSLLRPSLPTEVLAALLLAGGLAGAEPIQVDSKAILLHPGDPTQTTVGVLSYRGGLELSSTDDRFGGLSGVQVDPTGRQLTAVTDQGHWITGRLLYDTRGFVSGFDRVELGPLRDLEGRPLEGKQDQDAESLAAVSGDSLLVGFERHHRLWLYPRDESGALGRPVSCRTPDDLLGAPANGGLEAVTALADGRVLILTEEFSEGELIRGWLGRNGEWSRLSYRANDRPRPSDAALLPSGDVLVLERDYLPVVGNLIRLRRIPRSIIEPGALLEGSLLAELRSPLNVDNLEGIACRRGSAGETFIYLLSDDNFNPAQRTLLLLFALEGEGRPVQAGGAGSVAVPPGP